jgi:hypothetical protein
MKFNEYQSDISNLLESSPKVYKLIMEAVNSIPFMRHVLSNVSVRGYAKDRERDKVTGRISVDVTKPHMIEDMDFFRERALFFDANGKYTSIYPSRNPFSDYAKFWKEEKRRFKEGLTRESDGEWIPGYYYFYLNYSPIWLVEKSGETKSSGKAKGERVKRFPQPYLGDYLFFHYFDQAREAGQHTKMLKSRGVGMSFKAGALGPCNMIIYPGTGNPNFYLASDKTYLSGDKGVYGKVVDTLDWLAANTPFPRMRLTNSLRGMEIQLGYLDAQGNRQGNLASVYGISLKDNPDKARGIRGPMIFYEEDGLFPHLEKAWNVNRPGMEAGSVATGIMFAGGTGGTEGASFEGSKKLFYSPAAYNIYGIPNFYDKNSQGLSTCGFFWGAYMNREECNSTVGEPNILKALVEIMTERALILSSSVDPAAITQKKAEHPLTPEEAIMRTGGNMFPVADISEYLIEINANKEKFLSSHYVGKLVYNTTGGVRWLPDPELFPIRGLDTQGNKAGAVEIFEMPKYLQGHEVQAGRYIAGIDPIDQDEGESLFSINVMDLFVDRVVAHYIGRHARAEECYEEALKLLRFYNAKANYENNLKGLYSYFKYKNSLHYLANTPDILKDMDFMKSSNNDAKGTRATAPINAWGRQLQVSWMLTAITQMEEDEVPVLNLHRIRSIRYLEECLVWNPDGNYDMVSSMGMLFIYREEMLKQVAVLKTEDVHVTDSWADSTFFNGSGIVEKRLERMKMKFEKRD